MIPKLILKTLSKLNQTFPKPKTHRALGVKGIRWLISFWRDDTTHPHIILFFSFFLGFLKKTNQTKSTRKQQLWWTQTTYYEVGFWRLMLEKTNMPFSFSLSFYFIQFFGGFLLSGVCKERGRTIIILCKYKLFPLSISISQKHMWSGGGGGVQRNLHIILTMKGQDAS